MKKIYFLPLGPIALSTILCGLVYGTVQQSYRAGANDPQIQIAEDASVYLSNGAKPSDLVGQAPQVDISKSLAPFMTIFDESGNVLATSGFLAGTPVSIPNGVFDFAKANSENRVTWEPQKGVRSAIVVIHYKGATPGFVVVGRSLREVEIRVQALTQMVLIAWVASLILIVGFAVLVLRRRKEIFSAEVVSEIKL